MASITNESNGRKTIQFVGIDGIRRSVRLGKVSKSAAEMTKLRIERIVAAKRLGEPVDPETARWLQSVDGMLASRLANAGLIERSTIITLGELVEGYITRRTDLKPKSLKFLWNSGDRAKTYFGAKTLASKINRSEVADWRRAMLEEGLSEASVRAYARGAKQIFNDAIDREIIDENPFRAIPTSSVANTNDRIVTREEIERVLDACPSQDWRTLVALCRFGGLRCPSETHLLAWPDVDLPRGRMVVRSPKTERHAGHEARVVPIQPPLARELAKHGEPSGAVIPLSRHNLHRRLSKIVTQAGVEPWHDPFHCLRRSCQTDWAEEFPEHAVAKWIGNSVVVARRHYLKVSDDLIARAAGKGRGA
ncbi:MAG: tyrosine-type recombinase/integrase [Planctomycetota bacterium]